MLDFPKEISKLVERAEAAEAKIAAVQQIVQMTEDWCENQGNGIPDTVVCMAAMKDIRRLVR